MGTCCEMDSDDFFGRKAASVALQLSVCVPRCQVLYNCPRRGLFDERRIRSEGMSDDLKRDGLNVMGRCSEDRVDDTVLRNLDRLERR